MGYLTTSLWCNSTKGQTDLELHQTNITKSCLRHTSWWALALQNADIAVVFIAGESHGRRSATWDSAFRQWLRRFRYVGHNFVALSRKLMIPHMVVVKETKKTCFCVSLQSLLAHDWFTSVGAFDARALKLPCCVQVKVCGSQMSKFTRKKNNKLTKPPPKPFPFADVELRAEGPKPGTWRRSFL